MNRLAATTMTAAMLAALLLSAISVAVAAADLEPVVAAEADAESPGQRRERIALEMLDRLDAGDYEGAREHFNDEMRAGLPAATLEMVWNSLPTGDDGHGTRGEPRRQSMREHELVIVALEFDGTILDARVAFDPAGEISGFWMLPSAEPPTGRR